jgi:YMGG-like Gly-zipper
MKKGIFVILLVATFSVAIAHADELHLRSGQTIEGTFLGADTRQIKFLGPDGAPRTFALNDVEGITFAYTPPPPPPPPPPPRPKPTQATVLTGATVLVRMVDSLDTSKTQTGAIFTATLETSLVAQGYVVAHKGTTFHGKVTKSENAKRMTGRSELQLALTDIVINGIAHPLSTSSFQEKGKSETGSTVKKTAVGAGLGAAIGGIAGNAGKGAAIGAVSGVGLSAVKKGEPIRVPSETLLEFTLSQPVTLPVS